MATQQVLFAETIAGMKKAFKRKAYDSDSDSEIEAYENRGHKLKKRGRFAHRGQLVPTEGPSAYKEASTVDYAGVRRTILYRNPPLVDEDGYEVDSGDDDDRIEDAIASAAELNPYANVQLEHVLAPLTASTDLPTHPTLSKPFTSQNLTDLVVKSSAMMRRENESLWQVRHLWTALCGDHTWVPCESMIGPNDTELYTEDHVAQFLLNLSKGTGEGEAAPLANGAAQGEDSNDNADVTMTDANTNEANNHIKEDGAKKDKDGEAADGKDVGKDKSMTNGNTVTKEAAGDTKQHSAARDADGTGNDAPSVASEATEQQFVHPLFLPPAGVQPDRDLGIPEGEAEEVRRLLALFIQKQEEVCRGTQRLHDGLSKAHRLRGDVLHWSKAEAHSGVNRDMSDGEDWYDREAWGLTEDLKKGQDDEEEDTTTTAKTRRARR